MHEFRICATCGYKRGFHVFFREVEKTMLVGLICPNCGQSYDPGWQIGKLLKEPPKKMEVY